MNNALRLARAVLLAGSFALCGFALEASASPTTTLHTDPSALGLKPGEQGALVLVVEDVQDLYGAEVHLAFDPNIVEVVDANAAQAGVQIQSGDWLTNTFVAANMADNAAGQIDYAVTLLNPAPPMSGSGALATITFKAKAKGSSALTIEKAILATRDAVEIQAEWRDGAIGVSASGKAPNASASTAASNTDTVLAIAAGVGMLAFIVAAGIVAWVVWRRRPAADESE